MKTFKEYWMHGNILSRVSNASGCRARQCLLLCSAKSIPCCGGRQNEHCRARNWARVEPDRGGFSSRGKRDFSVLCCFSWDGLVAFRCFFRSVD
jgi:hypothetical protein